MMLPSTEQLQEAVARFRIKNASVASALPVIAIPALGAYFGRSVGARYGKPELGQLLGGITGGLGGQVAREALTPEEQPAYTVDPTVANIPDWALQGAQVLRPAVKSASEGIKDIIFGDTLGPIYPLAEGIKNRDMAGAAKGIAGQGVGVAGGGLAGYGVGKLVAHMLGRDLNLPVANIPLSTILSGLGATIGGVKGLQYARGQ